MNKISAQIISTVCLSSGLGTFSLPAYAQQSANLTKIPTSEIKNDKGIEETYTKKLSNNTHNFFQNFLRVIGGDLNAIDDLNDNINRFLDNFLNDSTDLSDKDPLKKTNLYDEIISINRMILLTSSAIVYFSLLTRYTAKLILERKIRESESLIKRCNRKMENLKTQLEQCKAKIEVFRNKLVQHIEETKKSENKSEECNKEIENLRHETVNTLSRFKNLKNRKKKFQAATRKANVAKNKFKNLLEDLKEFRKFSGMDIVLMDTFDEWEHWPQ